ncbi:WD repeat-containing protein RUP2 [Ziziphus jujuba]|uniref:WD repeat-containing protein RUP2 n=2 Tax=Ziziphus jujuba TaxID=326968 RepID=A0A6P3ZRI5_ZIZJJ|nr:WD repeat-containing protein RUP2 [Ziziphus jujuba]KAH7538002.1 hypothetical protein FEM48_Zijuj03G0153200 [Ziziphus jujuba var. spinosa]
MGAFHWPKTTKSSNNSIYEWEMKNLLTKFHLPDAQEDQNPETKGKEKENTNDEDKQLELVEEKLKEQQQEHERARSEWDFKLSAVVSTSSSAFAAAAISDALGVIEFDQSEKLIATGGIARKIRIYRLQSLLSNNEGGDDVARLEHANACDYYMTTPAKLSSLRWRPGSDGRILGSGDYDGVVMEYDLERRVPVFERDEHGGRRVWSVDYSHWGPVVAASGSDDGTMQMWDPRCDGGKSMAAVQPSGARSSVCCVEFNPFGGPLVAVGCADRKAYGYDVRRLVDPVLVLDGHDKTVSYVRFFDGSKIVSAGTDGCLKLWNTDDSSVIRTYKGHTNRRSFVGLSVWRNGGLLGCGSENNQVFVYDTRWGQPIWVHEFGTVARACCDGGFVSCLCWRQVEVDQCTLVAGGSNGVLQVFVGRRKSFQ